MADTNAKRKLQHAIWVGKCAPGESCEASYCDHHPANYSINHGSGYVTACRDHAQELIDEAVADGSIYSLET